MKYNPRVNVLYDTLCYHIAFFNEKTFTNMFKQDLISDDVSCYGKLLDRSQIEPPAMALYPFFYLPSDSPCALTRYFVQHFDCFNGTFETFILSLQVEDTFRRFIFTYYRCADPDLDVEAAISGDAEVIAKIVAANSFHGDNLPYLANLFFHFTELTEALIAQLQKMRPIVEDLHSRYRNQIDLIMKTILTEESTAILKSWTRMPDTVDLRDQTFSFCFIHQDIFYRASRQAGHAKEYLFMIGYNYKNIKTPTLIGNQKTFDPLDILKTLGHSLRYEIIELLRQKPMTVSQLAQELHIARTSIIRCITLLLDETVLLPSTQRGAENTTN